MATGRFPNRIGVPSFAASTITLVRPAAARLIPTAWDSPCAWRRVAIVSPDASFYRRPFPLNKMRFVNGPPTFAVEVRSENDRGPAAEREIAAKRADYFEAGTKLFGMLIRFPAEGFQLSSGRARASPHLFAGQIADAEPAVPGWRIEIEHIFAGSRPAGAAPQQRKN